jgi:hypothetical protein
MISVFFKKMHSKGQEAQTDQLKTLRAQRSLR